MAEQSHHHTHYSYLFQHFLQFTLLITGKKIKAYFNPFDAPCISTENFAIVIDITENTANVVYLIYVLKKSFFQ